MIGVHNIATLIEKAAPLLAFTSPEFTIDLIGLYVR